MTARLALGHGLAVLTHCLYAVKYTALPHANSGLGRPPQLLAAAVPVAACCGFTCIPRGTYHQKQSVQGRVSRTDGAELIPTRLPVEGGKSWSLPDTVTTHLYESAQQAQQLQQGANALGHSHVHHADLLVPRNRREGHPHTCQWPVTRS